MSGKNISGFIVYWMIILLWGCADIPSDFASAPNIVLDFCSGCVVRSNVRQFEKDRGSRVIELDRYYTLRTITNHFFTPEDGAFSDGDLFLRQSKLPGFSQYIFHYYNIHVDYPTIEYFYNGYSFVEFNCGTEPFGYDTTKANIKYYWEGRYPGLTPVRDVPLDSFKLGYYSIVKWLYSQETDRYKVKRKKYEQFDHDYSPTKNVQLENLVLEDTWQEEFLFTTYELIDTRSEDNYDYPILTVVPYTLAPIHLYEVRPPKSPDYNKYMYRTKKYHINIADMAIRVYKYPPYDEM